MKSKTETNTGRAGVAVDAIVRQFYIPNDIDRPCEDHIAERWEDGRLYYVSSDLRNRKEYYGMELFPATLVEQFGITLEIKNGALWGEQVSSSKAKYRDGRVRRWQGSQHFYIPLSNDQMRDCAGSESRNQK